MAAWLLTLSLMGFTISGCAANTAKTVTNENTVTSQQTDNKDTAGETATNKTVQTTSTTNRDLSSIYFEEDLNTSWDKSNSTIITLNGSEAKVEGSGANYSDGKVNITSSGTYVLSGKFSGQFCIDAGDSAVVHLVLNGVEINSESGPAIYAPDGKKLILTLADSSQNILSDTSNYTFADGEDEPDATLFVKNDLVINGSGTLKINANYKTAIKTKDTLAVISGDFELNSTDNAIRAKDALTVEAGTFKINASGKGFTSDGELNIYGGDINIENSEEGLEGLTVEVYGGNIDINATDDGINARTKYDDSVSDAEKEMLANQDQDGVQVLIAGGTVNINAAGDAIDSNGDLYIEGGETYVNGPTNDGNGTLDYNGEAKITGGVYVGVGTSGMFQTFSQDSSQNFINAYYDSTQAAGTSITLSDESGSKLVEFLAEKEFSSAVISLPNLEEGKTYTLKTGDSEESVSISSISSTVGTSNGGFGGFGERPGGGDESGGFGGRPGGGDGNSGFGGRPRGGDGNSGFGGRPGGGDENGEFGRGAGQQPPNQGQRLPEGQNSPTGNQGMRRERRAGKPDGQGQYGSNYNEWAGNEDWGAQHHPNHHQNHNDSY